MLTHVIFGFQVVLVIQVVLTHVIFVSRALIRIRKLLLCVNLVQWDPFASEWQLPSLYPIKQTHTWGEIVICSDTVEPVLAGFWALGSGMFVRNPFMVFSGVENFEY